jgi:hypothetical protein
MTHSVACLAARHILPAQQDDYPTASAVGAFLSTWIARPAPRLYVNPPRPDYGLQYNGVGECPF